MSSVIDSRKAQELVREALIRQARELEEELNMRQILEMKDGEVLFVEGFSVKDIYFPKREQKEKRTLRGWFKGLLARILRLFSYGSKQHR